jgi:isopentenyl-diphosphate Delta-isomerase
MVILFVCMGNTYRSRLAEAYLRWLAVPGVSVSSAGVRADMNLNGPITSYARELIDEYGLADYGKRSWTALEQGLLARADMVVCMNRQVYDTARAAGFEFPLRTFIWDIPDVSLMLLNASGDLPKVPHIARKTFGQIIERVNELTVYVRRPQPKEMVDILTPDGRLTGRRADVDTIHARGLWHQGIHAVLFNDADEVLFEKRSAAIIGNPGLWDLTLGGISAAGEVPEVTLTRELEEELGVGARPDQVRKLFVWRYNHYLPRYGLHSRTLVHTYAIRLAGRPRVKLQESEVAAARYLPLAEAGRFVNAGRGRLGEMIATHHYFRRLLEAART